MEEFINNYQSLFKLSLSPTASTYISLYYYKFDRLLNAKLRKQNYEAILESIFSDIKTLPPPEGFIDWFTFEPYKNNPWIEVVDKITNKDDLDSIVNDLDKNLRRIAISEVQLTRNAKTWRCLKFQDPETALRSEPFVSEYISTSTSIQTIANLYCKLGWPGKTVIIECNLDRTTKVIPVGVAAVQPEAEVTIIPGNEITQFEKYSSDAETIRGYIFETTGTDLTSYFNEAKLYDNVVELYRMYVKSPDYISLSLACQRLKL